jgi:hypothetical protein
MVVLPVDHPCNRVRLCSANPGILPAEIAQHCIDVKRNRRPVGLDIPLIDLMLARSDGEGSEMGVWLARIYFPDGTVRYATYSTVVGAILADLYERFCDIGEINDSGYVCHRAEVSGDPVAAKPGQPLSEPDEIIHVRIEVQPDRDSWIALYCPRRNQVIGPHSRFLAHRVQQNFELVGQNGSLHLVPDRLLTKTLSGDPDGMAKTLCGEAVIGEILAFHRCEYPGNPQSPFEPAARDLFAEWQEGLVCRQCLLQTLALKLP